VKQYRQSSIFMTTGERAQAWTVAKETEYIWARKDEDAPNAGADLTVAGFPSSREEPYLI